MKKVFLFIVNNIGKVDVLHDKITTGYEAWQMIYGLIQKLRGPAEVAPVAPLDTPAEPAPAEAAAVVPAA